MKFTKRLLSLLLSLLLAFSLSGCKTSTEQGKSGQRARRPARNSQKPRNKNSLTNF